MSATSVRQDPLSPAERIRAKRVYSTPTKSDGNRILVDRLWPRGMSKDRARLTGWMKEVAPSEELRNWFHRNPEGWPEFRRRYEDEIAENHEALAALIETARSETVTLLFASADTSHNNAVVLRDYLRERTAGRHGGDQREPAATMHREAGP